MTSMFKKRKREEVAGLAKDTEGEPSTKRFKGEENGVCSDKENS